MLFLKLYLCLFPHNIGLYYEGRGIDIILEIAKERLDINFHLVGGNKEELDYWSQIASKNIFFHGYIDNSLVGEYLKAFDIVLMPYQLVRH